MTLWKKVAISSSSSETSSTAEGGWVNQLVDSSRDMRRRSNSSNLDVDSNNNVHIVATDNTTTNNRTAGIFSFDPDGNLLDQNQFTNPSSSNAYQFECLIRDSNDDFIVGGINSPNSVLAKLDSTTKAIDWVKHTQNSGNSSSYSEISSIREDTSGNYWTAGEAFRSVAAWQWMWLAKHNSSGVLQSQTLLGTGTQTCRAECLVLDSTSAYISGRVNYSGSLKGAIAKYDLSSFTNGSTPSGTLLYDGFDIPHLFFNPTSSLLYAAGYHRQFTYNRGFWGTIDPSTMTLQGSPDYDIYVTNGNSYVNSGCVDPDGNIYILGSGFVNDFNQTVLLVVKFDSTGNVLWKKYIRVSPNQSTYSAIQSGTIHYSSDGFLVIYSSIQEASTGDYAPIVCKIPLNNSESSESGRTYGNLTFVDGYNTSWFNISGGTNFQQYTATPSTNVAAQVAVTDPTLTKTTLNFTENLTPIQIQTSSGRDIEDLFSTHVYTLPTTQSYRINNGIDLLNDGGAVIIKQRDAIEDWFVYDTEMGGANTDGPLSFNSTAAAPTANVVFPDFNTDGITLKSDGNLTGAGDYVSYTLKKKPKFFDIVTWTGDSVYGRTISHNLGSDVGCIIIKRKDATGNWPVWHRGYSATNSDKTGYLDSSLDFRLEGFIFNVTSTGFDVGDTTVTNISGGEYVAYVFAHNDGDGDFGPFSDQDIIKCGSLTTDSSGNIGTVNLGWEPQWILIKSATSSTNWLLWDTIRGLNTDTGPYLSPNNDAAESPTSGTYLSPTSTGFTGSGNLLGANLDVIYIAIRRGPMAVPEIAADVFTIDTEGSGPPAYTSGFPVDMALERYVSLPFNNELYSRLTQGKFLKTNTVDGENTESTGQFDYQDGWHTSTSTSTDRYSWMWKRAPKYFDVVTYTGDGSTNTMYHNLGVAPEMMWVKRRNGSSQWRVYHKYTGNANELLLNSANAAVGTTNWNSTSPTSSVFSVGTSLIQSGDEHIAYLFATLDGISKVGSFSGDNTNNRVIDCGFSNGARFVLVKCTNQGGTQWFLFDSLRGITTGNDPVLLLNETNAQQTTLDLVAPHSSGFAVNYNSVEDFNQTGNDYIFYAIA